MTENSAMHTGVFKRL